MGDKQEVQELRRLAHEEGKVVYCTPVGAGPSTRTGILTYEQAKEAVASIVPRILTEKDYYRWCVTHQEQRKQLGLPGNPQDCYKRGEKGWISWFDFLGKENPNPFRTEHVSYENAAYLMRNSNIRTKKDFQSWTGRPGWIPSKPHDIYPDFQRRGGWRAFLGTRDPKPHDVNDWLSRLPRDPSEPLLTFDQNPFPLPDQAVEPIEGEETDAMEGIELPDIDWNGDELDRMDFDVNLDNIPMEGLPSVPERFSTRRLFSNAKAIL